MPVNEILPGESACCKRIEDLKIKDHEENCQDFILRDESFFINEEEQWQDHRNEYTDDGQQGKKVQGHREVKVDAQI